MRYKAIIYLLSYIFVLLTLSSLPTSYCLLLTSFIPTSFIPTSLIPTSRFLPSYFLLKINWAITINILHHRITINLFCCYLEANSFI